MVSLEQFALRRDGCMKKGKISTCIKRDLKSLTLKTMSCKDVFLDFKDKWINFKILVSNND